MQGTGADLELRVRWLFVETNRSETVISRAGPTSVQGRQFNRSGGRSWQSKRLETLRQASLYLRRRPPLRTLLSVRNIARRLTLQYPALLAHVRRHAWESQRLSLPAALG